MSNFPEYILKNAKSALCLFAGEGFHEVKYINEAGIKDVFIIDNNYERIAELARRTNYIGFCENAFDWIERAGAPYKKDIVVSDQYTNDDIRLWPYFEKLKSLANQYLIISVCQKSIDEGLKLPEGELLKRSTWLGGVYWHITKIGE